MHTWTTGAVRGWAKASADTVSDMTRHGHGSERGGMRYTNISGGRGSVMGDGGMGAVSCQSFWSWGSSAFVGGRGKDDGGVEFSGEGNMVEGGGVFVDGMFSGGLVRSIACSSQRLGLRLGLSLGWVLLWLMDGWGVNGLVCWVVAGLWSGKDDIDVIAFRNLLALSYLPTPRLANGMGMALAMAMAMAIAMVMAMVMVMVLAMRGFRLLLVPTPSIQGPL